MGKHCFRVPEAYKQRFHICWSQANNHGFTQ